jgi:hypothetical protein
MNAQRVVEQAIGELDGTPLEDPNVGKNPAAGEHASIRLAKRLYQHSRCPALGKSPEKRIWDRQAE